MSTSPFKFCVYKFSVEKEEEKIKKFDTLKEAQTEVEWYEIEENEKDD